MFSESAEAKPHDAQPDEASQSHTVDPYPAQDAANPEDAGRDLASRDQESGPPPVEDAHARDRGATGVEVFEADATDAPAAGEEEEVVDPLLTESRARVLTLEEQAIAAQRRADELAVVARKQTDMADELYAENKRLREGEVREATAPIIRGLARLADDLSRMRSGDGSLSEDLRHLNSRVEDLLHDAGVLSVHPEVGDSFDPQMHQATGTTPADGEQLDRSIAEVRRAGLRRDDGRILRPADVVVYRVNAPRADSGREQTPDDPSHPQDAPEAIS